MRKEIVKIFVASSITDFESARAFFQDDIQKCNEGNEGSVSPSPITLKPVMLEPSMYGDRQNSRHGQPNNQKRIEKKIPECQYFFCVFGTAMGKSVASEILTAYEYWKETRHPFYFHIYCCVNAAERSAMKRAPDSVEGMKNPSLEQIAQVMKQTSSDEERARAMYYVLREIWDIPCVFVSPEGDALPDKLEHDILEIHNELCRTHFDRNFTLSMQAIREQWNRAPEERNASLLTRNYNAAKDLIHCYPEKYWDGAVQEDIRFLCNCLISDNHPRTARSIELDIEREQKRRADAFSEGNFRSKIEMLRLKQSRFHREAVLYGRKGWEEIEKVSRDIMGLIDEYPHLCTTEIEDILHESKEALADSLCARGLFSEAQYYYEQIEPLFSGTPKGTDLRRKIDGCRRETGSVVYVHVHVNEYAPPMWDDPRTDEGNVKTPSLNPDGESGSDKEKKGKATLPRLTDEELAQLADEYMQQAQERRERALKCPTIPVRNVYWAQADKFYRDALNIYDWLTKRPENHKPYAWGYAVACNNYANLFYDKREYQEAIRFYSKAIALYHGKPDGYTEKDYQTVKRNLEIARNAKKSSKPDRAAGRVFSLFRSKK